MRNLTILFLTIIALHANALEMVLKPAQIIPTTTADLNVGVELDVFGLSYHSNRDYDFNEVNPGLGISLVAEPKDDSPWHFSMVASFGSYKDSYRDQSTYFLVGPRLTLGHQNSFHVTAAVQAGWVSGSGKNGQAIVPFASIGYDWLDIGITGDPVGMGDKNAEYYSKVVAGFLKFRVLDF
jgi:hypothetical protein